MAIVAAELKVFRAQVNNDTTSNGARMDRTKQSVTNTSENVFPEVSAAELVAGKTEFRKTFPTVDNAGDLTLNNAEVFIDAPTAGGDFVVFHTGTQRDTQNDLTGSERLYGSGDLDSNIIATAVTLDVLVEDWTNAPIFVNGDKVRIDDGTNTEYVTLSAVPSPAGDVITLTWVGGLSNGYSSTNTTVSSIYEYGDVVGAATTAVVTSASGTFDDAQLTVNNVGSVEQDITLTFTSATAFDATGDEIGAMGSGNISSTFAPTNADTGTAYFTILSAAWGGTYATSDTVTFTMSPPSVPVWEKHVIPAGTSSLAGNSRVLTIRGESSA